jgi:hypothetical protein
MSPTPSPEDGNRVSERFYSLEYRTMDKIPKTEQPRVSPSPEPWGTELNMAANPVLLADLKASSRMIKARNILTWPTDLTSARRLAVRDAKRFVHFVTTIRILCSPGNCECKVSDSHPLLDLSPSGQQIVTKLLMSVSRQCSALQNTNVPYRTVSYKIWCIHSGKYC